MFVTVSEFKAASHYIESLSSMDDLEESRFMLLL